MSRLQNGPDRTECRVAPATLASLFFLAVALIAALFIRLRLLNMPLERDEGEFAYCAQLLLAGVPPFHNAYVMKLPGIHYAYASLMFILGESIQGIRLGYILVNAATASVLYLFAERHWGRAAGFSATAVFLVLSLSQGVLGLFAHATNFVNLFLVAGFLLLSIALKHSSPLSVMLAALLFGTAITMKQHAVFVSLYALLLVMVFPGLRLHSRVQSAFVMLAGMGIPAALILMAVAMGGTFRTLRFWVIDYAQAYATGNTVAEGWQTFRFMFGGAVSDTWPLWLAGFTGIAVSVLIPALRNRGGFLFGYFIASCLAIMPGFHFRPHYFVLLLPPLALGFGALTEIIRRWATGPLSRYWAVIPSLSGIIAMGFMISAERDTLLAATPEIAVKLSFQTVKPFAEAPAVGRYIAEHTKKGDSIMVAGSEPEIFFYSGRRSVTGHLYMYPLVEQQPFQQRMRMEFLRQAFSSPPPYAVFVSDMSSWLMPDLDSLTFYEHLKKLIEEHYVLDGLVLINRTGPSSYYWGDAARLKAPVGGSQLLVYSLKKPGGE